MKILHRRADKQWGEALSLTNKIIIVMNRKNTASIIALTLVVALSAFTPPKADVYQVDVAKSKIAWLGQNVAGGKHTGEIGIQKGELILDGDKLTGGSFTVATGTITVTDLEGDRATRLANHLKNEDFFDAPKFPEATFKITDVTGTGNNLSIIGNLTIKDITRPVTFPATVSQTGNTVKASAKGVKIDRTQFDVKYRSGNFFSGLGDRAIADEFQLDIELVATK